MRLVASWGLVAALSASAALATVAPLPTTMNADPATGTFGLCFGIDCANALAVSLYQITAITQMNDAMDEVLASSVRADFSVLDAADLDHDGFSDPMIRQNGSNVSPHWQSGTLFARTCLAAQCHPRPSNESEFKRLRTAEEGAIGVRLDLTHVQTDDDTIESAFETYHNARGALRFNLSLVVSPPVGQSATLTNVGISFLVATYEDTLLTVATSTSSSVDGHAYLQRVQLGSDMFMDMPKYIKPNGAPIATYLAVKAQPSGALQNLVLVTILLGDVTASTWYEGAFSSQSVVNGVTDTPAPAPTAILDSAGAVVPTQMRTNPGGSFGLCLDPTCAVDGVLSMGFSGLQANGSAPLRLMRFADSPAFKFSTPSRHLLEDMSTEVITSHIPVYVPPSAVRPPNALQSSSDVFFDITLAHFLSAATVIYAGRYLDVPAGAIQFGFKLYSWAFAASSDSLELSMAITLTHPNGSLARVADNYVVVTADKNLTLYLPGRNAIEFPTVALAGDFEVPVDVQFAPQDSDLTVLIVAFTVQAFTGLLAFSPAIVKTNVTYTAPIATPSPSPTPSPTASAVAPTSTPTPTQTQTPTPTNKTTMTVDPSTGTFGLCFWADCINSLSVSLYQITTDTTIDTISNEVTSADVVADFSKLATADLDQDGIDDPIIRRTDADPSRAWTSGTLYARTCLSVPCVPRPSNETEFEQLRGSQQEDAVGLKLEIAHVQAEGNHINSTFESYNVARGALRLNLSVAVSPGTDHSDTLPMFGVSFLVAAFEHRSPTIGTSAYNSVDGHMYLQRIQFGSDMYLDLPRYAAVNGVDTTIYTSVTGNVNGELTDLVLVTLMFGPVTKSIGYEAALASATMTDGTVAPTTAPTPAPAGTILDSAGVVVPTQLRVSPGGGFSMCLDAACSADGTLSMGFAGLQVKGSAPLRLARFANAPAFQFSAPTRAGSSDHGVFQESITSRFEAAVPQSAVRPPTAGFRVGDSLFIAVVEHFLSAASVDYGGHALDVPRGAIKFTVETHGWVFASPSDTLELSMAVTLVRADGSLSAVAGDYYNKTTGDTTVLVVKGAMTIEFPTFAIADGSHVPVGIAFAPQDRDGTAIVVTYTFPAFTQTLLYDPVMKLGTAVTTTTSPTPSTTTPATSIPAVVQLSKSKRQVDSWGIAGFLLGFLALVVVVSLIQCVKKARVKLDFTKIIP